MQNDYRTSILSLIERYKSLTPVEIIKARFPDQPDLSAIQLGQYTAATFLSIGNHVIESLERAMKSTVWHTLTASVQGHNEYGQVEVNSTLTSYVDLLTQKDVDQAAQQLSRLVWYCMACGIWIDDKSVKPLSQTQIKLLADELSLSAKRLESQLGTLEKSSTELTERRQDLVNFTEEKKNELGDIKRGLEESRKQLNEQQTILEQATSKDGEILTIKEAAQSLLNDLKVQLGIITKTFDEFKVDAEKLKVDINDNKADTALALEKAETLRDAILAHKETIERYVGMSVDGYLGNKFDARAEKLNEWLRIWQIAVPISVVLSIIWVVVVFTFLRTQLSNDLVSVGINLLKTTPAFILMGFVFGQYGKERNLQEEYAFKGAVAMTINVYADLLAGKDEDSNKSRQQLILNALKQVHTQPRLYNKRGGTLISIKAKEMRETMGILNDTLTKLKP